MTTLQEYLNQKYPTKEEREKVRKVNINKKVIALEEQQLKEFALQEEEYKTGIEISSYDIK